MARTVFNDKPIVGKLQAADKLLDDMTPVYRDMGEYLIEVHRERFRLGVDPDGNPWAPKSPVTIERYRRQGDGDRLNPLIGPSRRLSTEISMFANQAGVEVGSSLEYSGVMQEGAAKGEFGADSRGRPIPWGNIPARVWLGLSEANNLGIIDIVDEHLEQLV